MSVYVEEQQLVMLFLLTRVPLPCSIRPRSCSQMSDDVQHAVVSWCWVHQTVRGVLSLMDLEAVRWWIKVRQL